MVEIIRQQIKQMKLFLMMVEQLVPSAVLPGPGSLSPTLRDRRRLGAESSIGSV